jgi:hypothetical protein
MGDVNGDGIPDIVCNHGQILLGKGDGTFYVSPHTFGEAANFELLDLNGDGVLDILGLNTVDEWGFTVFLGNGNGTFQAPTFYPVADVETQVIAVGDFNGDGFVDAVTVGDKGIWLMTGKGGGVFNAPVLAVPGVGSTDLGLRAADMNNDGMLDIVLAAGGDGPSGGVAILLGNGNGTFQAPVTYLGYYNGCNITVADINSDGYLDVLCASSENASEIGVWLGEEGGKLRAPYVLTLPNNGDVEVGDVNGDGIPDLVTDSVYVSYGLGHDHFSNALYFPTAGGASQVVLANLRSPKLIDLVVNAEFTGLTVLLNKGNGRFIEGVTTAFPSSLGCGTQADFNNDGIPDLGYIQNSDTFLVMLGTGKVSAPFTAGPTISIPSPPTGGAVCFTNPGDLNGDGIPDFIVYETNNTATSGTLYPLFGKGDGNFTLGPPTSVGGDSLYYLVDVNGDGKADLINPGANQIEYGNGDGTFQKPIQLVSGVGNPISSVSWADLNGDGKPDLVVQVEDGIATYILLSNSSDTFTQTSISDFPADTFAVALGDLNGDGVPDLLLGSVANTMVLFINDGTGKFTRNQQLEVSGLQSVSAPTVIDLNGDGLNDIAVADGSDIAVLTNEGNLLFSQPKYFGQLSGGLFFGNWHGQAANAGLSDIMMPSGAGTTTMLLNETK